jgi:hypothetical protein
VKLISIIALLAFSQSIAAQKVITNSEMRTEFLRLFQEEGGESAAAFLSSYLDSSSDEEGVFYLGWGYFTDGEYDKAELIGWQLSRSRVIKIEASSYLLLGLVYHYMESEDYTSVEFFNKAKAIAITAGLPKIKYRAEIGLAENFAKSNELGVAQLHLSNALRLATEHGQLDKALYHRVASRLALREKKLPAAEFHAKKAVSLYKESGTRSFSEAKIFLAFVQVYMGKYSQAVSNVEAVLPFFRKSGDSLRLATGKTILAIINFCLQETQEAKMGVLKEINQSQLMITNPVSQVSYNQTITPLLNHCGLKENDFEQHRK